MKTFIISAFLIFSQCLVANSNSHFSPVIGTIVSGNPVITLDLSTLKSKWENFILNNTGTAVNIDQGSIYIYHEISTGNYILVSKNVSGTISYGILLEISSNLLYEKMVNNGSTSTTCQCSVSGENCQFYTTEGTVYCGACNQGDCNTVVVSSQNGSGIFY